MTKIRKQKMKVWVVVTPDNVMQTQGLYASKHIAQGNCYQKGARVTEVTLMITPPSENKQPKNNE